MKKLIVAMLLLLVLVVSVASCSCDSSAETTAAETSDVTTPSVNTQKEPIYDTDTRWGDLIPMKPVK